MNWWEFKLKAGGSKFFRLTDEEARELEQKYPEVKWTWNGL
jgi:hypothetical protein